MVVPCLPKKLVSSLFSKSTKETFSNLLSYSALLTIKTEFKGLYSCKPYHTKTFNSPDKQYPQPVFSSHPHQLSMDEITPLLHKNEFDERRLILGQKILEQSDRTKANIVIVPSAAKVYMSGNIPYVFRQNSDFLYLTGCLQPNLVLVLTAQPGSNKFAPILFMPPVDAHTQIWEGPKIDFDFTFNFLGIRQAYHTSQLSSFLMAFAAENKSSGVQVWRDISTPHTDIDSIIKQINGFVRVLDLIPVIHQLRVVKSPAEQELMRRTCNIIAEAGIETMKIIKPGICESHIWASIDYHSRVNGAQYLAYPPVVAGGKRANTIHYISNNQLIKDGELVLVDAGCEFHGYTSDMTRCWPINGKFNDYQKQAYEVVLCVQQDLINFSRERPSLDQLFQRMCRLLGTYLEEIGFRSPSNTCVDRAKMAYSVCPHHVSHYLGLDVHDTGRVSRSIPLQPGMVITIEPGLYVDLNRNIAPKEFHGIGLRIEDDVLITESGVEVLTRSCPKSVLEIEKIVQSKSVSESN